MNHSISIFLDWVGSQCQPLVKRPVASDFAYPPYYHFTHRLFYLHVSLVLPVCSVWWMMVGCCVSLLLSAQKEWWSLVAFLSMRTELVLTTTLFTILVSSELVCRIHEKWSHHRRKGMQVMLLMNCLEVQNGWHALKALISSAPHWIITVWWHVSVMTEVEMKPRI